MSGGRIHARKPGASVAPAARLPDSRPWPARTATPAPAHEPTAAQPPLPQFDFRKIPLRRPTPAPSLQAKLEIGAVNDPLEREADAVADRVMRAPDASSSASVRGNASSDTAQRKCTACEDEEKLQRKSDGSATSGTTAPPVVHEALASPGVPLEGQTRSFMESRFGYEFGDVRLHSDALAQASAAALQARAYTVGDNIVLGATAPSLDSNEGHRLLAHELTHVVQQGYAGGAETSPHAITRRSPDVIQRDSRCKPGGTAAPSDGDVITGFNEHDPAALSGAGWAQLQAVLLKLRTRPKGTEVQVHAFGTLACSRAWGIKFQVLLPNGVREPISIIEHDSPTGGPDAQRVIVRVAPPGGAAAQGGTAAPSDQTPWGNLVDPSGKPKPGVVDWLREGYVPEPVKGIDDIHLGTIELISGNPARFRVRYRDQSERVIPWTDISRERTPNLWAEKERINRLYGPGLLDFVILSGITAWSVVGTSPLPLTAPTVPTPGGQRPYVPGRVPLTPQTPEGEISVGPGAAVPKEVPAAVRPAAGKPPPTTSPEQAPLPTAPAGRASMFQVSEGPGVAYGKSAASRLAAQGKTSGAIIRPLIAELNAQPQLTPMDRATAMRVACNSQGGTFGAGPIVRMPDGDLVVTPRAANPSAPVVIVKPDGNMMRGNAYVKLVDGNTVYEVTDVQPSP